MGGLLAASLSACGSTVQLRSTATSANGDGLGPNPAAAAQGSGSTAAGSGSTTPQLTGGASSGASPEGGPTTTGSLGVGGAAAGPSNSTPANVSGPVRTPITIGFVAAGDAKQGASQAGANSGNTVTLEGVFDALVRDANLHGGLAGRPIKPVKYIIPVTETNYDQALAGACTSMTQDHRIDVVISALGFYGRSFVSCLAKAHLPQVEVGNAPTDKTDLTAFPSYIQLNEPEVTSRFASVFTGARAAGLLPTSTKVGVVLEDCAYQTRAYQRVVPALASSYGIKVELFDVNCVQGFSDAGALTAALQNAVLRFRSDGVTRVFFGTTGEAVFHLLFDNQANSQGYSPLYLGTSLMQAAAGTSANFGPDRLKLIYGWGYQPDQDVAALPTDPAAVACLKAARSQGINATTNTDRGYIHFICSGLSLVTAVLSSTAGRSDLTSFMTGLEQLGSSWKNPVTRNGLSVLAPGRHYSPSTWSEYVFDNGCTCFRYAAGHGQYAP